jgi:hypothetical protein
MNQFIYVVADRQCGIPTGIWESEKDMNNPIELRVADFKYSIYKVILIPADVNPNIDPKNRKDSAYLMEKYKVDISNEGLANARIVCRQQNINLPDGMIPAALIQK